MHSSHRDSLPRSLQRNLLLYDLQQRSMPYARRSYRNFNAFPRRTLVVVYLFHFDGYAHKKVNSHRGTGKSLFTRRDSANGRANLYHVRIYYITPDALNLHFGLQYCSIEYYYSIEQYNYLKKHLRVNLFEFRKSEESFSQQICKSIIPASITSCCINQLYCIEFYILYKVSRLFLFFSLNASAAQ